MQPLYLEEELFMVRHRIVPICSLQQLQRYALARFPAGSVVALPFLARHSW
jgi:hypothetical protein